MDETFIRQRVLASWKHYIENNEQNNIAVLFHGIIKDHKNHDIKYLDEYYHIGYSNKTPIWKKLTLAINIQSSISKALRVYPFAEQVFSVNGMINYFII